MQAQTKFPPLLCVTRLGKVNFVHAMQVYREEEVQVSSFSDKPENVFQRGE
jgi:hypothetical protein